MAQQTAKPAVPQKIQPNEQHVVSSRIGVGPLLLCLDVIQILRSFLDSTAQLAHTRHHVEVGRNAGAYRLHVRWMPSKTSKQASRLLLLKIWRYVGPLRGRIPSQTFDPTWERASNSHLSQPRILGLHPGEDHAEHLLQASLGCILVDRVVRAQMHLNRQTHREGERVVVGYFASL